MVIFKRLKDWQEAHIHVTSRDIDEVISEMKENDIHIDLVINENLDILLDRSDTVDGVILVTTEYEATAETVRPIRARFFNEGIKTYPVKYPNKPYEGHRENKPHVEQQESKTGMMDSRPESHHHPYKQQMNKLAKGLISTMVIILFAALMSTPITTMMYFIVSLALELLALYGLYKEKVIINTNTTDGDKVIASSNTIATVSIVILLVGVVSYTIQFAF